MKSLLVGFLLVLFSFGATYDTALADSGDQCWTWSQDESQRICLQWLGDGDVGIYFSPQTENPGLDIWNRGDGPLTFGTSNTLRWYFDKDGNLAPAYSDTTTPYYNIGAPLNRSQARGPINSLYMDGWLVHGMGGDGRLCFYGSCENGVAQQQKLVTLPSTDVGAIALCQALESYGLVRCKVE